MKVVKKIAVLAAAALGASLVLAAPGQAAETLNGACVTDLTLSAGSTQLACWGRTSGNVVNNGSNGALNAGLTALGYDGPAIAFSALPAASKISNLSGSHTVDFPGVLNGVVYLALHYGNGQGGPGNSTTFYKINAVNLDVITLNLNASSNAAILANVAPPPVPEPAAWAMMLGGFGLLGATMRRRQRTTVAFA